MKDIQLSELRCVKRAKSGSKPQEHCNRHERDRFRLSKIPLVALSLAPGPASTPPLSPTSAPVVGHLSQGLDLTEMFGGGDSESSAPTAELACVSSAVFALSSSRWRPSGYASLLAVEVMLASKTQ